MLPPNRLLHAAVILSAGVCYFVYHQKCSASPETKTPTGSAAPTKRLPRIKQSEFPPLQNDLLLRAARGERTERVPVWCMRQAGRYLPEFRAVRVESDFFKVCRTPELAAEVTLQPLRRFPLDAAIIFCDILVIPQAMGMEVQMVPGKGPVFPKPLVTPEDIDELNLTPGIEQELGYMMDAINVTRSRLAGTVPLIGFCGAPWTLLVYMVEGGGSREHAKARAFLYNYPAAAHRLLGAIRDILVDFLIAQHNAGAQALQVFETVAADQLPPDVFNEFCLPYLTEIAERVKAALPDVPLICFARGVGHALEALSATKYDVLGLDQCIDPAEARRRTGDKAVQGNFDPCALYAPEGVIRQRVGDMLQGFGTQGLIANLGHGMQPQHSPESVGYYVNAVHELSEEINQGKK